MMEGVSCVHVHTTTHSMPSLTDTSMEDPALQEWVHNLGLTMADKKVLESGRWLTANHIQAVNKLLQQKFPEQNGLQDTHMLSVRKKWNSSPDSFVQIIFVEFGHWACLSNKFTGCSDTIELFDSMHTIPSEDGSIGDQACIIARLPHSELNIDVVGVQLQVGSNDCGLFAISMALDLCCGIDPFTEEVVQEEMREHLLCCFEEEQLTTFSKVERDIEGRNRIVNSVHFELYCVCRMPESGSMTECSECREWYHHDCIAIPIDVVSNEEAQWKCPSCELHVALILAFYECLF